MNKLGQLLYPTHTYKCPACGSNMRLSDLKFGIKKGFQCPDCKRWMRISPTWAGLIYYGTIIVAIGITSVLWLLLGLPPWAIVFFVPAAYPIWVFTLLVTTYFATGLWPPKLQPYEPDHGLSLNLHDRP